MKIVVPQDQEPWPSLGPQVVAFIKAHLVHGPGDLRGEAVRMDAETEALIWRAYEVYPKGHPEAGRRRFKRVAISRRKGSAKTELAAWLAAVELHPDGPVRCDGWDADGNPVGVGVRDPYIALVAYTEEQSDELCYSALYTILSEGPLASDFDVGLRRIKRKDGSGRAVPLASAPDARDGAPGTLQRAPLCGARPARQGHRRRTRHPGLRLRAPHAHRVRLNAETRARRKFTPAPALQQACPVARSALSPSPSRCWPGARAVAAAPRASPGRAGRAPGRSRAARCSSARS